MIIVVVVIMSGILFFLYQQSVKINVKLLYKMDALTHELLVQDGLMEGDMSLLVGGRMNHYDTLAQGVLRLEQLKVGVDAIVSQAKVTFPALDALHQSLEKQKEPLERFKMELSIYHNSLRYLPTLLEQVQKSYPEHRDVLLNVYHELMHMASQPVEFDASKINKLIQSMDGVHGLKPVQQHLRLVLQHYEGTEASMHNFRYCGVDDAIELLSQQYHVWFDVQLQKAANYRFILLAFSVILLIYVAVMLWRLKRSNCELKKSHAFLHYMQKALDDHAIVTITDQTGKITYANDKACVISGYASEELIGQSHSVLKSDEHSPAFFKYLWSTIIKGETWHGTMKNKRKDGTFYWVETTITPFLNDKGIPWQYVSVRTDITQQIETEKRLKESHERYRTLFELTPYGLGIIQDKVWVYVNPAAVEMLGVGSSEGLLGKPAIDYVSPSSREVLMQQLRQACEQQKPLGLQEAELVMADGRLFDVEVQGSPLRWEGKRAVLMAMQDITVRKQEEAERKRYQENLEHKQRLESLGVLAGGIAHDFNNILTSIMGNTVLASQKLNDCCESQPYLNKVSRASERAAELCQQLLMYSGGGKIEKKAVLLSQLLKDVVDMVTTTMRDQIQLKTIVADDLPLVEADVRQLQQVVLNLLTNASEAIEGVGSITVELGVRQITSTCTWVSKQNIPAGEYVFLQVTDSGCGMDKVTQDKIFEPFFTTKVTGRGLGMSAILGIVHSHCGALTLESKVGQGTMICVALPVAHDAVLEEEKEKDKVDIQSASGTILVIDDEPSILELAQFVLEEAGFEVLTATDGEEGVQQFEANQSRLSAVVCDMVMPKLGGAEVAKHIHHKRPDLPILLSSGYDRDTLSKIDKGVITTVIQKPYVPDDLVHEVGKALKLH